MTMMTTKKTRRKKMKKNDFLGTAALLLGLAVLATGCDRNMSIAEIEA